MKLYLSLFLVSAFFTAMAQEFQNHDLQQMVDTERAFVMMAKEKNRKDAFLYYLSEDVITSGPGGPQKGKAEIEKQSISNDWLYWEVAFCDIASSGDFGYNTGPYEYRVHKTDEKPAAYGQFNSIWKKQFDGTWKNVLDIGTRHGATREKIQTFTSSKPLKSSSRKNKLSKDSFLEFEKKFIEAAQRNVMNAYKKFLSSESRLVHSGQLPIIETAQQVRYLSEMQWPKSVQLLGGDCATSGDLGYAYGTAEVASPNGNQKATYVRVWKKEDKNWKIVLDVLSF